MSRIAIVDGIRTPFCKMGTAFNDLSAQELGRIVTRELMERTGINPKEIDEVIFGNVCQPPDAANIARVIALLSGIPNEIPAFTVHRNCASGIEAAVQAAIKIKANEGDCFLVGGTESMSNVPFYFTKQLQEILSVLPRAKTLGAKLGVLSRLRLKYLTPRIGLKLGLTDAVCGLNMGQTAEVLAKEFGITRQEQDAFSLLSHQRALAAKKILREEIIPIIPGPKYKKAVCDDNGPRDGQNIEALTKLKPYFDRRSGTVTAGNSSQITDGAVALLIMTEEKAKELNLEPLGFLRAHTVAGVEPHRMGIGPAHAIPQVLKKAGMTLNDIDAIEINEAFATQVLACTKALASEKFTKKFGYEGYTGTIDPKILNINGGSIALGHPVGSTGARLILTLLKHLKRNNQNTALASLCIGGGQGAAVILEQ
ncbi:3-ketoacyl-CoA thiolase @ Acetyl-CoA acetyltransferase [hydrothermal vent metagenome]|uniref:3-ketoacyl-CoA thiolase @ Acetyl-CoA acetyltransferase n=1 Tax=hydrothermal vent metagenome TaxID=652676 RepID=A0A3B1D9A3_9ZZZZ